MPHYLECNLCGCISLTIISISALVTAFCFGMIAGPDPVVRAVIRNTSPIIQEKIDKLMNMDMEFEGTVIKTQQLISNVKTYIKTLAPTVAECIDAHMKISLGSSIKLQSTEQWRNFTSCLPAFDLRKCYLGE